MKKIHVIILFLMSVLALPAYGQLKLVQESFKQISNTDAANPNEWGDIDAQLLTRDDRTDENGVKNALLKLKVDKITQEDMEKLEFIADQGIFVKWIQQGNTPGEMWLLVTGMNTSNLYERWLPSETSISSSSVTSSSEAVSLCLPNETCLMMHPSSPA